MKKVILIFLLYTGTTNLVFAQEQSYKNEYGYYSQLNKTEFIFNYPKPGAARANFSFGSLPKGIRFTLELDNIQQMRQLINPDSILLIVKKDLQLLADSLKDDVEVRRVDYVITKSDPQIRITNHKKIYQNYIIKNGELNDLKIERDTLRIKYITNFQKSEVTNLIVPDAKPYFFLLIANNISDLFNLPDTILQTCINTLKMEVTESYLSKVSPKGIFSADFNMQKKEMVYPEKTKWMMRYKRSEELVPFINFGFQYIRGSFMPSFSGGLRYTFPNDSYESRQLFLMSETLFGFTKDVNNKTITHQNNFITLRYTQTMKTPKAGFEFNPNVSISYLMRSSGDYFEKNTFKLGLPGFNNGGIKIEPEFIFNGFVKNMTPSIKLTLNFE